jgi:hypothetical protein
MEINTDKTKSLVFNSTGRLFPVTLMIDNQLIEKVKQYRYLGVMFNASTFDLSVFTHNSVF